MNIIPVRDGESYAAALARIEALFDAASGTPEFDELDVLVTLVESYEDIVFPMPELDPIDAINFRLEQMGLEPKEKK